MAIKVEPEVVGVLLAVAAAAIVSTIWFSGRPDIARVQDVASPEIYKDLEFLVLHRPHVTYFIDRRYRLCFATRKPDFQDLAQFLCTDKLLAGDLSSLRRKARTTVDARVAPGDR